MDVYEAAPDRYDTMEYRFTGRSGLKLPAISLGLWQNFGDDRPEETQRRLAIDPHSPPEFRCNQVVRNLAAFHAAFGVDTDDELWLDPAQRVTIWAS